MVRPAPTAPAVWSPLVTPQPLVVLLLQEKWILALKDPLVGTRRSLTRGGRFFY